MRKWMRERIKRRKKAPEKGTDTAQAPLQPAYFDTDSSAPAASVEVSQPELEPESEPEQSESDVEGQDASAPIPPASAGVGGAGRPVRRRRRGRGGRGRGRTGTAEGSSAARTSASHGAGPSPAADDRAQPAAGAPPPAQPSKGVVVLAIGLPGSGKSSWFKRNKITPLSSDMLRALLFDDPTEQRFQDLIFSNLRSMLKARLIARRPTNYVDATNLTPHERASWIKLAKDHGYEAQAVFFDVPVDVCLQRNNRRERVVAEDVMRRMAAKLRAPAFEEGFGKITVVRVKQKE